MSGASITNVTPTSGFSSTYTVTVNTGSGNGTLGLNLNDNDSIVDQSSVPLGGSGAGNGNFTGQVYTIDKSPPSVTWTPRLDPNPTVLQFVHFGVNLNENVTGLDPTDFHLVVSAGITGVQLLKSLPLRAMPIRSRSTPEPATEPSG